MANRTASQSTLRSPVVRFIPFSPTHPWGAGLRAITVKCFSDNIPLKRSGPCEALRPTLKQALWELPIDLARMRLVIDR
jgi:hypothetical protein